MRVRVSRKRVRVRVRVRVGVRVRVRARARVRVSRAMCTSRKTRSGTSSPKTLSWDHLILPSGQFSFSLFSYVVISRSSLSSISSFLPFSATSSFSALSNARLAFSLASKRWLG